ncbi:MAG: hypothetical protein MK074_05510 [Phycisphaerales bacterium]|nr:hypothetical protein [Phycisphaerales bacterium]
MIASLVMCALMTVSDPVQQAPLLPEGTIMAQAEAVIEHAPQGRGLHLRLIGDDAPADGRMRSVAVLPSRVLEDLERFAGDQPNTPVHVTGVLTLYGGRNWILPVQIEHDAIAASPAVPDDTPDLTDKGTPSGDGGDGESVADIVADLSSSVASLRRGIRTSGTDVDTTGDVADDLLIVSRRGRVQRAPSGAWLLVLDADGRTTADPPLVLLPSRALAQIVAHTRKHGPGEPLLVSGALQHYRDHRYLLPSGWRVPRERSNLSR